MALTVLGGILFLGMQAFEWHHLIVERGMSIQRDLFDASFFILTGFHGCHVFGGVVYNSVLLIRGMMGKITQAKAGLVEICLLYTSTQFMNRTVLERCISRLDRCGECSSGIYTLIAQR